MAILSILLLGDANWPEFRDARACLDRWGTVEEFRDADSAAQALAEDRVSPDVIVVAQAFPGEFSHQAIDRLRRLSPLARVLGLMGSWCEGEMRSGSPWPATVRTYWHQWPIRCRREFERLVRGEVCSWALPVTATEEERVLADIVISPQHTPFSRRACPPREQTDKHGVQVRRLNIGESSGLVPIRARSFEAWSWLSAACRSRGFAAVWQRGPKVVDVKGATAAIFDGTDLGPDECDELQRMAVALQPAPVVALLSFPRIDQERLARSCGAAVLLSKPLAVEDLFGAL